MNPALKKILSDVTQFLTSQNIPLDPPEDDPDRRRSQKAAAKVMKDLTELDGNLAVYKEARGLLLNKAANSNEGRALVEILNEAGIGIGAATTMFKRLKQAGANENAIRAAVDAVIASLEKKPASDGSAAPPKLPNPGPSTPPDPGAAPTEKPPTKSDAKGEHALSAERSSKGKA